ncbi:MAG: hypothetical protein ACKOAV_08120 [Bacteroidota bacterium]
MAFGIIVCYRLANSEAVNFVGMWKVKRLNQFSGRFGVWACWILLVSACTTKNEIHPDYRLAGHVVTAGTGRSIGVPVTLALCYRDDLEGRNPLVTWATDSSGLFDHRFPWKDSPDKLRLAMLDLPPLHVEPTVMPTISSRSMNNLRIELPALGWLRWRMNLENMGTGGLAMIQAGSWIETLYQPDLSERIIPWNSVMPLQIQVTYRPSLGASAVISSNTLTLPPLDTLVWTWAP